MDKACVVLPNELLIEAETLCVIVVISVEKKEIVHTIQRKADYKESENRACLRI